MSRVKLCKFCKKHGTSRVTKGYTNEWKDDVYVCPDCKRPMIDIDYPSKDFDIITKISYEPAFIESMMALRKSNQIEYQLKLSQIRIQIQQQEAIANAEEANKKMAQKLREQDSLDRRRFIRIFGK